MRTILLVTANPKGSESLRLNEECKRLMESLKRGRARDVFALEWAPASTDADLSRALLDHQPEIVHFSGHGLGGDGGPSDRHLISGGADPGGLIFEDESGGILRIAPEALAGLFKLHRATVRCVILNACSSEVTAQAIVRYVDYAIGMRRPISDRAAVEFARGFYDALAAGTSSYEWAFEHGRAAIALRGLREDETPVLKVRRGVVLGERARPASTPKPATVPTPAKAPSPSWDRDLLRSIEAIVGEALGFDGSELVREAATKTDDLGELRRLIARALPDSATRRVFLDTWPF